MKRSAYTLVFLFLAALTNSCDDYLDTYPGDKYDDATVWKNTSLIESFLFGIYNGVPYPHTWLSNASLVDESVPIQNDGIMDRVLQSNMTPEEPGAFKPNWAACMDGWWWNYAYGNIRSCNLFFEKIHLAENTPAAYREQMVDEVHFLRAYFYYVLMAQYGGVPLIDYVVNIGDNYNIPRNTFEETINFILADLDAALADNRLAGQTDKTRATTGAVYALKSRVLLYAASELHHNTSWSSGYSHPELIGYIGGNRTQLYQQAKEAAEMVMGMGYSLYNENPDPSANFQELFLAISSNEQIFITRLDKVNTYWAMDWVAWFNGTPSYGGYGLNQVTANMANSFENLDGSKFNFGLQAADPFSNRDPRFNASILHHGSPWYHNANDVVTLDTIDITKGTGIDYKQGNSTGYYLKKFISPSQNDHYQGTPQPQPYIQLRYAEVLLNYAEACLGLGEETNARQAMNLIRQRAGMPDIPASETGQVLIDHYRNERKVELGFEVQRFFDVRRWMIAPEAYGEAYGIQYDGSEYSQFTYETHAWNDRNYLVPILYEEMQKNTALIQNPGY
ncbi:MAG TPA: RagB/SusD family nutrient uptake outer membrane protein [Bacteroidales bacterium]|nr:RagB/SusD family nutrient uptake outer membrane protein [Bacteroidales bacterium]